MRNTLNLIFIIALVHITAINLHAQEITDAIIYFYQSSSIKRAVANYGVYDSAKFLGKMTPGQVLIYRAKPGLHTFIAKIESKSATIIDVQPSKLYFIECGITYGVVVGTPSMRQVAPKIGIAAIRKINPALTINEALVAEAVLDEADFKADTLRALNNLYARKRRNGLIRGVIFASWSVAGLTAGDATVMPGVLVIGAVSVSGFAQAGKYNAVNKLKAIEEYKAGKPLSAKIKRKFKEKDFR
jgi:hypothetical protein